MKPNIIFDWLWFRTKGGRTVSEYFLELSNVSKTFPGVKALNNVQFNIKLGEVHALVGENGAGKSTLIKILAGVQPPDEGANIYIEGEHVDIRNTRDAIGKGISVIYQDFSLFGNLTVAENIGIIDVVEQGKMKVNWNEIYKKAERALKVLNSDIDPRETVENLSVAKQQMVAIATAIAQDAKMIIMDEPTSALSRGEIQNLYKIIDDLKARNIAILFISHKMDELFRVSDRMTVFRDGQYIGTVNKDDITESELVAMMVGREIGDDNYSTTDISDEVALEVSGLSKAGNFKDISFKLHKGEVLGITGLVGAGRTELAQAIFGINVPYEGKIVVDGEEIEISSPSQALEAGIAYVPEDRHAQGLVQTKSLESNITLPRLKQFKNKYGLIDMEEKLENAKMWMEKLDVRPRDPDNLAMQLSGGNQQKVVIAKWVSTGSKILIVDEPTVGVDIGAKTEIHKILRELATQGTSVIVISSELPEILAVCDRILVMRKGRIAGEFTNQEATQEKIMSKAVL
jgi:ABC-type sugar transport system ATPase subunit